MERTPISIYGEWLKQIEEQEEKLKAQKKVIFDKLQEKEELSGDLGTVIVGVATSLTEGSKIQINIKERIRDIEEKKKKKKRDREEAEAEKARKRRWKMSGLAGSIVLYIFIGMLATVAIVQVPPNYRVRYVDPHLNTTISVVSYNQTEFTPDNTISVIRGWPLVLLAEFNKRRREGVPTLKAFPLLDAINAEECSVVTPSDIASGRVLNGRYSLSDLKTTLFHHIAIRKFTAACAMHVGVPACYCVVDFTRVNATSTDYLELFNPEIIGVARNRISNVQERNVFCPQAHFVKRYDEIALRYLDNKGDLWEREFKGVHSYNLQHVAEIHRGVPSCLSDGTGRLMHAARGKLGGSKDKSQFEREFLFNDLDVYRNERATIAAPLPPTPLPEPKIK